MKPACDPSAGLNSLSPGDRYQLLGDQWDSKEVAIGRENFVIRGKAFFLQYLHLCATKNAGRRACHGRAGRLSKTLQGRQKSAQLQTIGTNSVFCKTLKVYAWVEISPTWRKLYSRRSKAWEPSSKVNLAADRSSFRKARAKPVALGKSPRKA